MTWKQTYEEVKRHNVAGCSSTIWGGCQVFLDNPFTGPCRVRDLYDKTYGISDELKQAGVDWEYQVNEVPLLDACDCNPPEKLEGLKEFVGRAEADSLASLRAHVHRQQGWIDELKEENKKLKETIVAYALRLPWVRK